LTIFRSAKSAKWGPKWSPNKWGTRAQPESLSHSRQEATGGPLAPFAAHSLRPQPHNSGRPMVLLLLFNK